MRQTLKHAGIDVEVYTRHSFRIGAATACACAAANVKDSLIKILGRWSSDCYERQKGHQNIKFDRHR